MCPAFFLSCLDKRADLTYSKIRNGPANRRQYQKAGGPRALALNRQIRTLLSVYYFSVPCSFTIRQSDGTYRPKKKMEPLFVMRSCQIGAYRGTTKGGVSVDDHWRENDGLVNTFSAGAPVGEPAGPLDKENIRPGRWNILPTYDGDHMALQGGLMRKHDVRIFYLDLLQMIRTLEA